MRSLVLEVVPLFRLPGHVAHGTKKVILLNLFDPWIGFQSTVAEVRSIEPGAFSKFFLSRLVLSRRVSCIIDSFLQFAFNRTIEAPASEPHEPSLSAQRG